MNRCRGYPLVAPDNVRRPHKVVIDYVCKMIGRDAVGFKEHHILHIFGHFNFTLYHIVKEAFSLGRAGASEPERPLLAVFNPSFCLFKVYIAIFGIAAPNAFATFVFLRGSDIFKLLLGHKAGISQPLGYKPFGVALIYFLPCALIVRSVIALFFTLSYNALIGYDSVKRKPLEHNLNSAFNLPFLVGILNAHEENSVG